ncbi:hypothetical protein Ccrd_005425, partial [Cynara cardunculus var. scolymus]
MACVDIMYNHHHHHHHHHHQQNSDHPKSTLNPPISPRISFSNDFAESLHSRPQNMLRDYNAPPVSSDFEFSVSNNSMMTADELFFKGRLLPFKDAAIGQKTTLREELLAGEDEDGGGVGGGGGVSFRPPKASSSSTRWKGFLGLRKSHIGSKRSDKGDGSRSGSGSGQDEAHISKIPQNVPWHGYLATDHGQGVERASFEP